MNPAVRFSLRTAALFVAVLLATPLHADIAPDPLVTGGSTPKALEEGEGATSVALAWEEVDLYPTLARNRVHAVFGLEHPSGKAVTFEVGFPSYREDPLRDFQVRVGGELRKAEVRRDDPPVGARKRIFTYWMCWPMTFEPGQKTSVQVDYWCETDRGMQPLWIGTLPDDLRSRLARRRTGYVLRTGAAWAGTIGRTTIRLHYGKEVPKGSIRFLDRAGQPLDEAATRAWSYDPENSEEVLVLRNLEPDANSDIRYEITPLTPREEATVLREALAEKRLRPWAMKHLLELVVEEDALGTAPSERGALVLGILREMVPPRGPTFAQEGPGGETPEGALSAGEEQVLVAAYRRLLSLPAGTLEADEIPAIRHAYRAFLGAIVGRKKAWYDANPAKQTGRSWEEYRKLEAEWEGLGEGEGR